jgi:hypothetical protein
LIHVIPRLPKPKKSNRVIKVTPQQSLLGGGNCCLCCILLYLHAKKCVDLFRRTLIVVMDVVFLRGGLQKQEVHCINDHPHMVDGIEAVGVKSLDMS